MASAAPTPSSTPAPTPKPPLGGTELLGYVPYWQMTEANIEHLRTVPLSTLALFSVTSNAKGDLKTGDPGYRRIAGPTGARIIAEAHARGTKVELVFTSFGFDRNSDLFNDPVRWSRTVEALVAFAGQLGVDGLDVDVELIRGDDFDGYASFLTALRQRLLQADPKASMTVATEANHRGAALARAAIAAGVDRVFLMGYDYHWTGSDSGASAPLARLDGTLDLPWSIDEYVAMGVPRDGILLGLPLYGMSWPVDSPWRYASTIGKGAAFFPSGHLDELLAPGFVAAFDPVEIAQYFVAPDRQGWRATFYDSPESLRPKLELARHSGLAGAGFWAIGYERGLPGYPELMTQFRAGSVGR